MAINHTCFIEFDSKRSLQEQVREYLVKAIFQGIFPAEKALPSCRKLATQLKVSRNTVSLVYESLQHEGYLISKPRSGYYLNPDMKAADREIENNPSRHLDCTKNMQDAQQDDDAPNWQNKFKLKASQYQRINKPSLWSQYKYPFIYGQPSMSDFPLTQWREATRKVTQDPHDHQWLCDKVDKDVEILVEQIRTRVLPQRGIHAQSDEILITLGSQNALFLIAQLFMDSSSCVGVENPGYKEAYNIFELAGAKLSAHPVDASGISFHAGSKACDFFYVTPSHQAPTGVTLSDERRMQLMKLAQAQDAIIIEDDYDSENNLEFDPKPALKAQDKSGRVIYVGSFSKILAPGMRLGYVVASEEIIYELRTLRRLMYRHPPSRIQMEVAHFISQGYFDSYVRRYRASSRKKWELMHQALQTHIPQCQALAQSEMSNSLWLKTPQGCNSHYLASKAAQKSVLIETGQSHFILPNSNLSIPDPDIKQIQYDADHHFRLGFHAIASERIEDGIKALAQSMN